MDERSIAVIEQHLLEDPDPTVRGRIAETIGPHLRSEFFDLFLQAIADPSRLVQAPALLALSDFMGQLDEEQTRTLRRLAAERAKSEDEEVREAALYLVEEYVAKWAGKAREAALKANLSEADSIFGVAVAYAPTSKQGRYYQGTYYLDFVERERGIEILRTHPAGRCTQARDTTNHRRTVGDEAWEGAARIDSFFVHGATRTTLPPLVETRVVLGYSDTALYWGVFCADAHPESLVVRPYKDGPPHHRQDSITFRLDRNLDTKTIASIAVNSAGLVKDGWNDSKNWGDRDYSWDAEATVAAYVGDDFWSVECELRWDPKYHPPPVSGELSGTNFIRLFRAAEWSHPLSAMTI